MDSQSLETKRLIIRTFTLDDVSAYHRIFEQGFNDGSLANDKNALAERQSWMQWSILSQEWFPRLHQPPYGERAIELKTTGEMIGGVGYVPCLNIFEQIPELRHTDSPGGYYTTEFGLFWVIDPKHQRQGYATEAAQAMIKNAFTQLRLKRIIATTEYTNEASQAVMRKVGMKIAYNPQPEPPWLQVVGILENSGQFE